MKSAKQPSTGEGTVRDSNFELLRIISMLGIILTHYLACKMPINFVTLTDNFESKDYFYDFITNTQPQIGIQTLLLDFFYGSTGHCAIWVFMIITGYFLFGRPCNYSKYVQSIKKILITVLWYGLLLVAINFVLYKISAQHNTLDYFKPLFELPNWFSGKNLWYIQAYGIFLLIIVPLLKLFESKLTQTMHRNIVIALICTFFLNFTEHVPNFWMSERIRCFILFYYIGGYLSKYKPDISWKKLAIFLIGYLTLFFSYDYYWRKVNHAIYAADQYSYVAVKAPFLFCLIFAVLAVLIFQKIHISSRLINIIASATMGIYIFHFTLTDASLYIANLYWWKDWTLNGYFYFAPIYTFATFFIGLFIDLLRQKMFSAVLNFKQKQENQAPAQTT